MKEQKPPFDDVVAELMSAFQDPQYWIELEEEMAKDVNELADYFELNNLTPVQIYNAKCVIQAEAVDALDGYLPLCKEGGLAYEQQKQWILEEITTEEYLAFLKSMIGRSEMIKELDKMLSNERDVERQRRIDAVEYANASVELEGFKVSKEQHELDKLFIDVVYLSLRS
jgi:hypothetical protein